MLTNPISYYQYDSNLNQEAEYFRVIRQKNLARLFSIANQIAEGNQELLTINPTLDTVINTDQIAGQLLSDIQGLVEEFANDPKKIDTQTKLEISSDPILILEVLLIRPDRIVLFDDQIKNNPELAQAIRLDPRIKIQNP
ncbi:hypothetical protein KA531_03115 [Candidatus Saccharibacteria bacterium]|nr:hypothetical protein [Candidatus Saccharibacteria bacterium]